MLITCLRHATAEIPSPASADAGRPLIKKGRNQVLRVAEFCRKNGLIPSVLYSSPLVRAQQTASLFQRHLPDCPPPEPVDWLAPEFPPEAVISALCELQALGVNNVWLVGHEPGLSNLLGKLLGIDGQVLNIKKASLTRVEAMFEDGQERVAQMQWSLPCALMR